MTDKKVRLQAMSEALHLWAVKKIEKNKVTTTADFIVKYVHKGSAPSPNDEVAISE